MERKPVIELETPFLHIKCEEEFSQLTQAEKLYSYHLYNACWEGAKICYFQRSYESPGLFILLQLIFQQPLVSLKAAVISSGVSEEDYQKILAFSAGVFQNCGNYKSFGDTKFVPDVTEKTFEKFVQSSKVYEIHKALIDDIWLAIRQHVFDYSGLRKKLGFPGNDGYSGYYSSNLQKIEAKKIEELLKILNLSELNTRVVKLADKDFVILVASINMRPTQTHVYNEFKVRIVYGDFSAFLRRSVQCLIKALPFAANINQRNMLKAYIDHFETGDMETHKDSQRHWVRDKVPNVETNMGFIETYLDPMGVRAEYEGFVAVVNQELSKKTGSLVKNAELLLEQSPWPKAFEKDAFLKPDFTILVMLAFASSGAPLGINIPNYDDIRQEEGFKNVYLINCLPKPKKINFLNEADVSLTMNYYEVLNFQKVAYHELLGHGCGKLFQETNHGLNFDVNTVVNPLTGGPITSWYQANETWSQKFGSMSNAYEECRADSVALYYASIREACHILTPEHDEHFDDICYAVWLSFVHQGVCGLEFYSPEQHKWGQAHCQGRFVMLRMLLEAGKGFINIQRTSNAAGRDYLLITIDRTKIFDVGFVALKKFLLKMMVYKSTADLQNATQMFEGYSAVDEYFLDIRRIVVENALPRRIELQSHLSHDQNAVIYESFGESFEGIIQSYMRRYPYFDQEMWDLWKEYREYFRN